MALMNITAKKKPIEMVLVQRARKASMDRDLFFVKNVSEPPPVIAPILL